MRIKKISWPPWRLDRKKPDNESDLTKKIDEFRLKERGEDVGIEGNLSGHSIDSDKEKQKFAIRKLNVLIIFSVLFLAIAIAIIFHGHETAGTVMGVGVMKYILSQISGL